MHGPIQEQGIEERIKDCSFWYQRAAQQASEKVKHPLTGFTVMVAGATVTASGASHAVLWPPPQVYTFSDGFLDGILLPFNILGSLFGVSFTADSTGLFSTPHTLSYEAGFLGAAGLVLGGTVMGLRETYRRWKMDKSLYL